MFCNILLILQLLISKPVTLQVLIPNVWFILELGFLFQWLLFLFTSLWQNQRTGFWWRVIGDSIFHLLVASVHSWLTTAHGGNLQLFLPLNLHGVSTLWSYQLTGTLSGETLSETMPVKPLLRISNMLQLVQFTLPQLFAQSLNYASPKWYSLSKIQNTVWFVL